jgi:hypothetical protein
MSVTSFESKFWGYQVASSIVGLAMTPGVIYQTKQLMKAQTSFMFRNERTAEHLGKLGGAMCAGIGLSLLMTKWTAQIPRKTQFRLIGGLTVLGCVYSAIATRKMLVH